MKSRRLLKVRMILCFVLAGILAFGAPEWKRIEGGQLLRAWPFFLGAVFFLWAALRDLTSLRADVSSRPTASSLPACFSVYTGLSCAHAMGLHGRFP